MALHDSLFAQTAAATLMQFQGDEKVVHYFPPNGGPGRRFDAIVGAIRLEQEPDEERGGFVQVATRTIRLYRIPGAEDGSVVIRRTGYFMLGQTKWGIRSTVSSATFWEITLVTEADEEIQAPERRR